MLAGTIGVLDAPADEPLSDTTENDQSLPALAVSATQSDLDGEGIAQECTAAARVEKEREEPVVYDGGITTSREPHSVEVVSDLVTDVTGTGVVVAERLKGGDPPFPFTLVSAQTGRNIQRHHVDVEGFVRSFDADDILDTWLVGSEDDDGEGVTMDYNDRADPEKAPDATVGFGFTLSWNETIASGVLYASGYVAIHTSWTAAVFCKFVADRILPHAYTVDNGGLQATLA